MMRRLIFATAICAAACLTACASDDGGSAGRYTAADVEYKLAVIAGETPSESNIEKYDTALDNAEPVCRESRHRIGDMVVVGQQEAAKDGKTVTLLELLRMMPTTVPAEMQPTPCADIIAAFVTLL